MEPAVEAALISGLVSIVVQGGLTVGVGYFLNGKLENLRSDNNAALERMKAQYGTDLERLRLRVREYEAARQLLRDAREELDNLEHPLKLSSDRIAELETYLSQMIDWGEQVTKIYRKTNETLTLYLSDKQRKNLSSSFEEMLGSESKACGLVKFTAGAGLQESLKVINEYISTSVHFKSGLQICLNVAIERLGEQHRTEIQAEVKQEKLSL